MENKVNEQLLQDGICILNGLSHWDEVNVDKMVLLRFLTACQNYFSAKHSKLTLVENLEDKVEILNELLNDLLQKESDRFVVYAVQKAMAVLLKFNISEVKMKTYLNQTISLLEDDICLQSKISILDLLIDLLQGETVHQVLDVVKVWFPQLAEKIIKVPSQKDEEMFFDTFLILWRKSLKQCQDLQIDNLWLVDYEKLIYILFNTDMADYIHFKNVIHLLKTFYPYGFSLCLKTSIEPIYIKIGTAVFQWALTQGLRCTQVNSVRAFGGTTILSPNEANMEFSNIAAIRQLAILVLAVSATIVRSSHNTGPSPALENLSEGLIHLNTHVTQGSDDGSYFDWIIDVFGDQDDALTEALLSLLDIYCIGKVRYDILRVYLEKLISAINPHRQFYLLLKMTGFDHTILVDLLTSPETCALLYFTRYLKCVLNEWCVFAETLKSVMDGNDSVSSTGQEEKKQRGGENSEEKRLGKQGNKKMSEFIKENENSNPTKVSCNQTSCTETEMECNLETTMNFDQKDMRENKLSIKNDFAQTVSDNIICSVVSGGLEMLQLYSDDDDEEEEISKPPSCQTNSNNLYNMVANEQEENIVAMEYDSIVAETSQKGDNSQDFSPAVDVTELAASLQDVENTESENMNSNHCLDETMATIIRVRLKLENLYDSNLLPFNPKPLVRLIEQCENLYES